MPKTTKEIGNALENLKNLLSPEKKSSTKDSAKKATSEKKSAVKKTSLKAATKKASSKDVLANATSKKASSKDVLANATSENTSAKDILANATTKKKSTSKKTSSKDVLAKTSSKKKSTSKTLAKKRNAKVVSKSTTRKEQETVFSPEYYDLPFKYNTTVVKLLAQTPENLFIYWEISDTDRQNLKNQYGEYFFEITKPVLVVYNRTLNYSFEVDINDFANSWYLKVNDSDCQYEIELGRRPIPVNYSYIPQYDVSKNGPIQPIKNDYIYISSSNKLQSPNDHILFNKQNKIYFRNVKTNQISEKDISEFPFITKNNVSFASIYELYEKLYQEEIQNNEFNFINPSSGNPSSGSFQIGKP